jgi:hypothetical protein
MSDAYTNKHTSKTFPVRVMYNITLRRFLTPTSLAYMGFDVFVIVISNFGISTVQHTIHPDCINMAAMIATAVVTLVSILLASLMNTNRKDIQVIEAAYTQSNYTGDLIDYAADAQRGILKVEPAVLKSILLVSPSSSERVEYTASYISIAVALWFLTPLYLSSVYESDIFGYCMVVFSVCTVFHACRCCIAFAHLLK